MQLRAAGGWILAGCLWLTGVTQGLAQDWQSAKISLEVWRDLPAEFLAEINQRLAPHERFSWYVAPALNTSVYPGSTMSFRDKPIKEILDEYCVSLSLKWVAGPRTVWIYREVEPQQLEAWTATLQGEDLAAALRASEEMAASPTPMVLKMVLKWAAGEQEKLKSAARTIIHDVLGTKPNAHIKDRVFAVIGHINRGLQRLAPLGQFGRELPAPWAALAHALKDEETAAAAKQAVLASKNLTKELDLLAIGALLDLPEAKTAVDTWAADAQKLSGGGWARWEYKYTQDVMPRIFKSANQNVPGQAPDYAAQVKEALDTISKQEITEKTDDRKLKTVRQAMDNGLRPAWTPDAMAALSKLLLECPHPSIREYAAQCLGERRDAAVVEPLAKAFVSDEHPKTKEAAAMALAECREAAAVKVLLEAFNDQGSPLRRRQAALALADAHHPEAGEALLKLLKQTADPAERMPLIQFLGLTRDPKSEAFLIQLLNDNAAPLVERQSAAIALTVIPTDSGFSALKAIMKTDAPMALREYTLDGLRPKNFEDVDRFLPVLMGMLDEEQAESLQLKLLENIQYCSRALPNGDPRRLKVAQKGLEVVKKVDLSKNVRKKALDTFKYADNSHEIAVELSALEETEKDPVLKAFMKNALRQIQASLPKE